jgi:hypothetical protein
MFNLPGLTNFRGCVQADMDITGIRSVNFPPFATSDTITACLYVNGRFFKSTGSPITFIWYPDRIERLGMLEGITFRSVTIVPVGKMAAIVSLDLTNTTGEQRDLVLKFGMRSGITRSTTAWTVPQPPTESDNLATVDPVRPMVLFSSQKGGAFSCQGIAQEEGTVTPRSIATRVHLAPGARATVNFVQTIGESGEEARSLWEIIGRNVPGEIEAARKFWNEELRAVFTPGNDRYSGFLPVLETSDAAVQKLYLTGILGVIYFKRDTPFSVIGRAYDTILPKWWQTVTFIWDYSLSSLVHALLDPAVLQKYILHWMRSDIHTHFGTEYLTGGTVGPWYSANDFALSTLARDYLRWTGDSQWLSRPMGKHTVIEELIAYANNWKQFRQPGGLADYGGLLNLLECVSTYVHQVASLNAGNVFSMRFAAELLDGRGDHRGAEQLRHEALDLVQNILPLYKEGEGYWRTRFPDGSLVDVKHCYDFFTVMNTIGDDLTAVQRREMADFFRREFFAPTWMHAISPGDDDTMFSERPDHQWIGAYPAWPPQALLALYRAGEADLALEWMHGLARSANQGPFGQAHFVASIIEPDAGGARKAPIDPPYITDWAVSSGGSWVSAIIEGLFGVQASLKNGISARPQFGPLDPGAELHNLHYQGRLFHVSKAGVRPAR